MSITNYAYLLKWYLVNDYIIGLRGQRYGRFSWTIKIQILGNAQDC